MKTASWLWWAIGAAIFFFVLKSRSAASPKPTGQTTGTATTPADMFSGWLTQTDQSLKAQTANVNQYVADGYALTRGIRGLFGGSSTATGSKSAVTSGSGAGVPIDYGYTGNDFTDMFGGWE